MSNAVVADFMRLFKSKTYAVVVPLTIVGYVLMLLIIEALLGRVYTDTFLYGDTDLRSYAQYSPVVIAILVSIFQGSVFMDGTIRNRIISGNKRSTIFCSACVVNAFMAFSYQIIATLSTIVFSYILLNGFETPMAVIVVNALIYAFAAAALAVFFTMLVFITAKGKLLTVIDPLLSVIVMVAAVFILDKLYPESGVCTLSATVEKIFTFCDEYLPFFHLIGTVRWNLWDYAIGQVGFAVISLVIGSVIFNTKEMN